MRKGFTLIETMIVIGIIAMMVALGIRGCEAIGVGQGVDMAQEVGRETLTGKNAIKNYEWFKMRAERIKGQYRKEEIAQKSLTSYIEAMGKDKTKWTASDKDEWSRLRMIVDGLRYTTDDMLSEYNAKTQMANRAMFKDHLPTNIVRGINGAVAFKWGTGLEGGN